MTTEQMNILSVKDLYLLKSTITKRAYIDSNSKITLYENAERAKEIIKDMKNVELAEPTHYSLEVFAVLANAGAKNVRIVSDSGEVFDINLLNENISVDPKTIETNSAFYQFLQSGNKQLFRNMLTQTLYIPVNMPARKEGHYPYISYMFASIKGKTCLTVFTNFAEFNAWNATQDKPCEALGLTLKQITSDIRKNVSLLFNPNSDKRLLTGDQILRIINKPKAVKKL